MRSVQIGNETSSAQNEIKGLERSTWKRIEGSPNLMRKGAVALATWGAFVLPTHGVVKNKTTGAYECSCDDYARKQAEKFKREWKPCAKIGKVPWGLKWQDEATNDSEIAYALWSERKHHNSNVGILCGSRSGLVGLDIDGALGLESLAKLEAKFGKLPHTVTVVTGSGGRHFWFRLPEGVTVSNSAKALGAAVLGVDATNVDVRGEGGQLIAPPSMHKSGNQYSFLEGCGVDDMAFDEVPYLPDWLVDLCEAAKASNKKNGKAKRETALSPDSSDPFARAAKEMGAESPVAFEGGVADYLALIGDHDGGAGFDRPIYQAALSYFARHGLDAPADEIHSTLKNRVLAAQCNDGRNESRYATDDYLSERIEKARVYIGANPPAQRDASKTFYSVEDAVAALNKVTAAVQIGSGTRFLICEEKGEELNFHGAQSAADWFANWRLIVEEDKKAKAIPAFSVWKNSPERRQFSKVVFRPDGAKSQRHYNVWRGLGVAPQQGGWRRLARHLFEVWCDCDPDLFEYTLAWFAQLFQQPEVKPGVAMVVYSPRKGTGKSIVARPLRKILDIHASTLSASDALTAKFNGFMERSLLVVGEEIIWGGKRDAIGPLKAAITESTVMLEKKYQDPVELDNFTRFLLLSNEERAIPAEGDDERRFFVLRAGEQHIQDTAYFSALISEIDNGGTEAFLHDLLKFDFRRVELRNPPKTKALAEQTESNLGADMSWWLSVLTDGGFLDTFGDLTPESKDWETRAIRVPRNVVFDAFNAAVKTYGMNTATSATIGKFLSKVCPDVTTKQDKSDGKRSYVFPPLPECREAFEKVAGVRFEAERLSPEESSADLPEMSDDLFWQTGQEMILDADVAMILTGGLEMEAARWYKAST